MTQCFCVKENSSCHFSSKKIELYLRNKTCVSYLYVLNTPHQILVSPGYVYFLDAVTLKHVKLQFDLVTWTPLSLRYAHTPIAHGSLRSFSECTVGKYHIMKIATIKLKTTRWNRLHIQFCRVRKISPSIKILQMLDSFYAIFDDFVWV